jgi:hypothetical protein
MLMVNGNRASDSVEAGSFAAIRRTWKDGDRIQIEFSMPLRLEAVDENHPNVVALLRGPLVLMAVAESQPGFGAQALLRARPVNNAGGDWIAISEDGGQVTMRPFMSIDKESYSTYVRVKSRA